MSYAITLFEKEHSIEMLRKNTAAGNPDAIIEGLRGWNWSDVLSPSELRVPFNAISYNYCPTRRDLYLNHKKQPRRETFETIAGRVVDAAVKIPITSMKQMILSKSRGELKVIEYLSSRLSLREEILKERDKFSSSISLYEGLKMEAWVDKILDYELSNWFGRLNYWMSHSKSLGKEKLARMVIPFELDHPMEVEKMGYSNQITPDFLLPTLGTIGELKTGKRNSAFRIAVTGYALAYELLTSEPIDVGFVLYYGLGDSNFPDFEVDAFSISNELRKGHIQYRNEGLEILKKEGPPDLADEEICKKCIFYYECWPDRRPNAC